MTSPVVLIVEDEADLREILVEELEVRGWKVAQADNGPAALELLSLHEFKVVVSDLRMPGFGGVELIRKWQSQSPDRSLPNFIFITGFSDHSESEVLAIGAKAVFQKPFPLRKMISCVEDYLKA